MTVSLHAPVFGADVEERLLAELHRAADYAPAYRALLDEQGARPGQVRDFRTFSSLCPLLCKGNTFDRFTLAQMSVGGELGDAANVLTSSGHGGRFSFGVISRKEASAGASFIDAVLDAAFAVKSRTTLAVNCLPMGVVFGSHCMTVATTSVREDMAVGVVRAFGDHYQQVVLVGDPLFMKRLTDYAAEHAVDWRRYRLNAVIGGEAFGEHFRGYMAQCLGLDLDHPEDGYIMSSLGVAELGLNLAFETPATIALRRLTFEQPALARDLLGHEVVSGRCLPGIFTFNPQRTYIEVVAPDRHGYGKLTVSMLDPDRSIPLLRYQTGDLARLLDRDHVEATVRRHGVKPGDLPVALFALQGRDKGALPNGAQVGFYQDALYANHEIARRLTGALRLTFCGRHCSMHVQLVKGQAPDAAMEQVILREIAADARPADLVVWPYAAFPFGMGLDYERKFSQYVPGERDASSSVDPT